MSDQTVSRGEVTFVDRDGRARGHLVVQPATAEKDPLWLLDEAEARRRGEERVQLLEDRRYTFTMTDTPAGATLEVAGGATELFPGLGMIEPGANTGMLPLHLVDPKGRRLASAAVEVRSVKIGWRDDYQRMLKYITDQSLGLLLQMNAPASARLVADRLLKPETLGQRFAFLQSLLGSRSFEAAVHQVVSAPHVRSALGPEEMEIARGGCRLGCREMLQLVSRHPRQRVPENHPLQRIGLRTLPRQVTTHEHRDFLDTPENRFVKHALGAFVQFLSAMERRVSGLPEPDSPANRRLRQDICGLRNRLQVWLGHPLFREVSGPDMLPLGSPVLQRRQGYREIYRAWMQFNLAARLVWQGGDDVFAAGKRDVAVLYEYWVFFRLLEAITALYGLRRLPVQELIERTADGFGLKLKSGRHLTIEGDYQGGPLPLRIRFAYNLTFSRSGEGEVSYPAKGSWTYRLRPDYTLSLWPAGLAEDDAERQEQIVHLHFDAKYRVQSRSGAKVSSIVDLFGDDADDAAGGAEQEERAGRMSKRSDLLKMHAYRDAIRRTEGAYIIYPGDTEKRWCGFRELLPGVGAFPVYPGDEVRGMRSITDFLEKVTVLCQDRFCQLRRRQYWTHEAAREAPQDYAAARPSPAHGAPPDDLTVTVGFVPPELQMVVRERRAFFFHAVYSDGRRAKVDPRELRGRYLVPYCNHGPIGWYAEAKTCRLVQRRTVERLIGAAAMAARDAGRDDSRRPTHYYVMRLGAVHDGLPVEAGRWRELIAARAPQGAPFTATWGTLWEGMRAES